jgi:hypothetical protein
MSKVHKEQVECPHCHSIGTMEMIDEVDADINPELRERVLNAQAFIYTCPECGSRILVGNSLFYHDAQHRFIIFFDMKRPADYHYQPLKLSKRLIKNYPDYTFRYVTGMAELHEKIIILESGLSDVAVEKMKYMIAHYIHPDIAQKGYKLHFSSYSSDDKEDSEFGALTLFYRDGKEDVSTLKLPMNIYYDFKLAVKLDPRMQPQGCVMVDEGWISRQMKGGAL